MQTSGKNQISSAPKYSRDKIEEFDEDDTAQERIETVNTTLSYLQSLLFGTILEDTATQLRILKQSGNEIKIIKTTIDWDYLQRKKFGVMLAPNTDELDGIDPDNLDCNEYKINKLDADSTYINDIIMATYVDLSLNRSFKALKDSVNYLEERDRYHVTIAMDDARNNLLRRELTRSLRQLRNHIKSVYYDADARITSLKSQVEDSVLNSECRDRYVVNWQRARTEQHIQTIKDTEIVYSDRAEYYKMKTDHEHRVHMEIELISNIVINETLDKIDNMMNKYEKDMEDIDLKIQIKNNEYIVMKEKVTELQNTIEVHEKLMKDWIYFKDEREKARLYREKMNRSAIAVQAWWRGLLVRLEIGPYKPTKKPNQPKPKK